MKYFFILGNNPTLSIAEIFSVISDAGTATEYQLGINSQISVDSSKKFLDNTQALPKNFLKKSPQNLKIYPQTDTQQQFLSYNFLNSDCLVIETKKELDVQGLIKRLGGTIKIGEIQDEVSSANYNKIQCALNSIVQQGKPKYFFGFSYYGKNKFNVKRFAMETKKYLKELDISCRWVISKEKTLSSVVVETNKMLTEKGAEIVLIQKGNKILIGKTLAVQDFRSLSFRDYDRPARDSQSGMLPPKLAQILINLTGGNTNDLILDPFCGSGTVVMEAMLMEYEKIMGSDISEKAVGDTNENIAWVKEKFKIKNIEPDIKNISATDLSREIKKDSIDAIATEPYLGPQRGRIEIEKVLKELNDLYTRSIAEFYKILKTGGRVAMVWPVFRVGSQDRYLSPDIKQFKKIDLIPEKLKEHHGIKVNNRNTIIYGRDDQRVWREVVVLEK